MFAHNYLPHPGDLEVMVWNVARRLAMRHAMGMLRTLAG
jgi:hypothetical protein